MLKGDKLRGGGELLRKEKTDPLWTVGIDASMTNTAVWIRSLSHTPDSYCLFSSTPKEGNDTYRIHKIAGEVCAFISDHKRIGMVAIEDYGPINRTSGKITQRAEIVGIVKYALHDELGLPFVTVPPKSLKSYACGNGNASKDDMINAAKKFGCFTKSHDEADAFHLARFAAHLLRNGRVAVAHQVFRPV